MQRFQNLQFHKLVGQGKSRYFIVALLMLVFGIISLIMPDTSYAAIRSPQAVSCSATPFMYINYNNHSVNYGNTGSCSGGTAYELQVTSDLQINTRSGWQTIHSADATCYYCSYVQSSATYYGVSGQYVQTLNGYSYCGSGPGDCQGFTESKEGPFRL